MDIFLLPSLYPTKTPSLTQLLISDLGWTCFTAEEAGIEPTKLLHPTVFKTAPSSIRTPSNLFAESKGFEPLQLLRPIGLANQPLNPLE